MLMSLPWAPRKEGRYVAQVRCGIGGSPGWTRTNHPSLPDEDFPAQSSGGLLRCADLRAGTRSRALTCENARIRVSRARNPDRHNRLTRGRSSAPGRTLLELKSGTKV